MQSFLRGCKLLSTTHACATWRLFDQVIGTIAKDFINTDFHVTVSQIISFLGHKLIVLCMIIINFYASCYGLVLSNFEWYRDSLEI